MNKNNRKSGLQSNDWVSCRIHDIERRGSVDAFLRYMKLLRCRSPNNDRVLF